MSLKLITPPSTAPITLAEAKAHLRVEGTADDALITGLIGTAVELCEQRTGRALMPQTWRITLDAFPPAFQLTRLPVASVAQVQYVNTAGVTTTLPSNQYSLDNAADVGPHWVLPAVGATWPETRAQANAAWCDYVAGWPDAAAVPAGIKSWLLLMVGALYANREATTDKPTPELGLADRLLDRWRTSWV